MKLQSLAVIFVIIILPISLVISEYIQVQLDSVVLMSSYDAKLNDATYDAIRAYQLNEQNSTTDGISNEKVRDINASISAFYTSLATSLDTDGYSEEDLKPYIPAIVYTLYDGYYIYGPYRKPSEPDILSYGLRPFIAYSEKYTDGANSVIINYTLDNYINVYGHINGEDVHRGGYLIDTTKATVGSNGATITNSSGTTTNISTENLTEVSGYSVQIDNDDVPNVSEVPYKYVNSRYLTDAYHSSGTIRRRQKIINDNGWKQYNTNQTFSEFQYAEESIISDAENNDNLSNEDRSAILYYKSAQEFSNWVKDKLSWVKIPATSQTSLVSYSKAGENLFSTLAGIDDVNSAFNDHRREVIRKSIESNLRSAIEAYNSISQAVGLTDAFMMPKLTEKDWDKILNNVSIISFMQNIIMKNNYQKYSGYSVVTNNQNKDYTDPEQLYIYDTTNNVAHKATCKKLQESSLGNVKAYKNTDFLRYNVFDPNGNSRFYYKHYSEICYDCIVNSQGSSDQSVYEIMNSPDTKQSVRNAYYTALAREKYNTNNSYKLYYDEY